MKAITIKQPFAWAIIEGGKDIENRDWFTNFRGRIAIHAGKSKDECNHDVYEFMRSILGVNARIPHYSTLPFGAIIGTVEIVDCTPVSKSKWFVGDYGFVLRDPMPLDEPIYCRGQLGLWNVSEEIAKEINK